jgi:hypothetical protein
MWYNAQCVCHAFLFCIFVLLCAQLRRLAWGTGNTRHVDEHGHTLYQYGARGPIRDATGLFKPPAHILKSIKLGLDHANSRELLGAGSRGAGHASEAPESDALPDLPAGDAGPVGKPVCVCVRVGERESARARGCERTCVLACMREY